MMAGKRWSKQARESFAQRAASGDRAAIAAEAGVSVRTVGEWVRKFVPRTIRQPVSAVATGAGVQQATQSVPSSDPATEQAAEKQRMAIFELRETMAVDCAASIWSGYKGTSACDDDIASLAVYKGEWDRLRQIMDDGDGDIVRETERAYDQVMAGISDLAFKLTGGPGVTLPACPASVESPSWDGDMHRSVADYLQYRLLDELCTRY